MNDWPAYEAGLRKRGDVTVWFDESCADSWNAPSSGLPGGQRRYSDLAIVTALTLRTVFHLALRQAEGFVDSLIRLMGPDLDTPDHTTLSRRSGAVDVPRGEQKRPQGGGSCGTVHGASSTASRSAPPPPDEDAFDADAKPSPLPLEHTLKPAHLAGRDRSNCMRRCCTFRKVTHTTYPSVHP